VNFDTRTFWQRLKSRKLIVLAMQWILGAILVRYGTEHPQYSGVVEWALGALGLSGGTYHLAQAHEDAATNKLPFADNQSIGGNVSMLNNPPTVPPSAAPFVTQPSSESTP
jgi:hypothetical protein